VRRRPQWRTEARTTAIAGLVTQSVLTKHVPAPSTDTVGGRIVLSRTFVAPPFTGEVSLCDLKFVKWLVRKNRDLSMSNNDDESVIYIKEHWPPASFFSFFSSRAFLRLPKHPVAACRSRVILNHFIVIVIHRLVPQLSILFLPAACCETFSKRNWRKINV
jgi:hypothetical protein